MEKRMRYFLATTALALCISTTAYAGLGDQPDPQVPTTWDQLFQTVYTKWGQDLTPGMGTFSRGFRIGNISKCSMKGMLRRSTECNMFVGNESTPLSKTVCTKDRDGNKSCRDEIVNPWQFSSGPENFRYLDSLSGDYWVVEYAQSQFNLPVSSGRDTEYEYVRAFRPTGKSVTCERSGYTPQGNFSNGSRTGRLVKLSLKGNFNKSFEAKMQEGPSGSLFVDMSITDATPQFVYCAYQVLFSGKKVKIEYAQDMLFNPTARDTPYEIVRISTASNGLAD
jgi:hypothetical protein